MGKLYDGCQQVIKHIDESGMDVFRTRGAFAMRLGFIITLVSPDTPDDPASIQKLKTAADEILGLRLNI